ncbi:hypothetical protein E2986_12315 [Frieseomelitta varia]|nr:hypothetical protein E2986_12315 [Frieseomelitta varia]
MVEEMVKEISNQSSCIVFVSDSVYRNLVDVKNIENFSNTSKYEIALRDNEQFLRPRRRIQRILTEGKAVDCRAYVILIANGYLTAEFLQYTERFVRNVEIPIPNPSKESFMFQEFETSYFLGDPKRLKLTIT